MKNTLKKVIVISKIRVFIKGGRSKQALFVRLFLSEALIFTILDQDWVHSFAMDCYEGSIKRPD